MALAELAEIMVLGVVPAKVPPFRDVPVEELFEGESTVPDGSSVAADGVYKTEVVVAFEPAAEDPDAEKEVEGAAPVAPDDAFDCR
jgi:hypothetical protein